MKQINKHCLSFQYLHKPDRLLMNAGCGWGLYLENSAYMFMRAFNSVRDKIDKDVVFNIALTDSIEEMSDDDNYFGYGTAKKRVS